ncbi:isopenicillin N synthase family oxygenase [bacterium]|nr:isopenicillin N synthase family oxygenase [bacterium]
MKNQVPELSLKAYMDGEPSDQKEFISQLFEGLKKYGFIILKDHPVSQDLLKKSYALSEQLFTLNDEQKMAYSDGENGGQRGYIPFGREHAKNSKFPDLKEFWHVGRDLSTDHRLKKDFPNNIWPSEVAEFKETFQVMFKALDDTGRIMLEALTFPLDVPKDYFQKMTEAGSSILRLLHYPPIAEGADPNCIRAAAHEDINLITLLVSAQGAGLELLTREGEWIPVETDPSNIIVDSGDMLARITNDVIPATTHRVVNPKGANRSRYSMPFFMHPNPDAKLECIASCRGAGEKYPPILANDFLMERLRDIGLVK